MRILVVDDDIELCETLKVTLEDQAMSVDTVYDGDTGSYVARTNDYDLIILDNNLPKKSGLSVCTDIRASGKTAPIMGLSIKNDVGTKIKFFEAGADDYVSKPFSYDEIRARVKAILRRPRVLSPDTLSIGTISLNTGKQIVFRGRKALRTTKREFALLEYLLRNRGVIVSRGMIMEHVWNMDIDPLSNTLETHVLNLRRKIDCSRKKSLIRTVSGRGYIID